MERQAERVVAKITEPRVDKLSEIVSKQIDRLAILQAQLQQEIEQ
jgi:hypothetical protein